MDIKNSDSTEIVICLQKIKKTVELIKKTFEERTPVLKGERYLTNNDMCKLLHMSLRTLQEYRDNGILPYIQISGKILYKETDILKLLEKNYNSILF